MSVFSYQFTRNPGQASESSVIPLYHSAEVCVKVNVRVFSSIAGAIVIHSLSVAKPTWSVFGSEVQRSPQFVTGDMLK